MTEKEKQLKAEEALRLSADLLFDLRRKFVLVCLTNDEEKAVTVHIAGAGTDDFNYMLKLANSAANKTPAKG